MAILIGTKYWRHPKRVVKCKVRGGNVISCKCLNRSSQVAVVKAAILKLRIRIMCDFDAKDVLAIFLLKFWWFKMEKK